MSNSQIETLPLPLWARKIGVTHCFVYHGPSMVPTFHNGDLLYVRFTKHNLQAGDVIVFSDPEIASGYTVHRIISDFNQSFITRGDHNRLNDAPPVSLEEIVGRVELAKSKNGIQRVINGNFGLGLAKILHFIVALEHIFRRLFWIPYKFIREKRLAAKFWQPEISKMQIQSEHGLRIKYLYKKRTVATWDPVRRHFDCRKPFDLVILSPLEEKRSPDHAALD